MHDFQWRTRPGVHQGHIRPANQPRLHVIIAVLALQIMAHEHELTLFRYCTTDFATQVTSEEDDERTSRSLVITRSDLDATSP